MVHSLQSTPTLAARFSIILYTKTLDGPARGLVNPPEPKTRHAEEIAGRLATVGAVPRPRDARTRTHEEDARGTAGVRPRGAQRQDAGNELITFALSQRDVAIDTF